MAHNDFIGDMGQWLTAKVPQASDWQKFDVQQSKVVHTGGGTWNPTTPIGIGGLPGVVTLDGTNGNVAMTGGVSTQLGGRILLGANDFPSTAVPGPRSRTMRMPLWLAGRPVSSSGGVYVDDAVRVIADDIYGGLPWGLSFGTSAIFWVPIPSRYLHHRANLATIAVNFTVLNPSASPPASAGVQTYLDGHNGATQWVSSPRMPFNSPLTNPPTIQGWAATHAYSSGSYVSPTNGFYYKGTAGTSAGTQPTWPTTIGLTVVDGGVTWTCQGRVGLSTARCASSSAFYANGLGQQEIFDYDSTILNTVDTANYNYAIVLAAPNVSAIYHSVDFTFTNITSLAFE